MDDGQELQNRIKSLKDRIKAWHDQVTAGQMSYQALADSIRNEGKVLFDDFSAGLLSFEQYETLRTPLILTDATGQEWGLSFENNWQKETPTSWEEGIPNLLVSSPPPQSLSGQGRDRHRTGLMIVAAGVIIALIVASIFLFGNVVNPSVTSTPPSSTVVAQNVPSPTTQSTPTSSPTTALLPAPTPTLSTPPDDTATSVAPTPVETTPSPTSLPLTSPETASPEPSSSTPLTSPTPDILTPPSPPTLTPIPVANPYGVIAYTAFDQETGTYNTYLRAWPDLKVIWTIQKAGQSAVQPFGSKLALRSWDGSRQGILIFDRQTQQELELTGPTQAIHPDLSPAGRLVYTANDQPDQKWRLYVNGQALPIDGSIGAPAWINEDQLAFDGCITNDGCGIFVINDDGSNKRQLTDSGDHSHRNPAPSPDGQQILFMSNQNDNWDIYRIAVDASPEMPPERLTTSPSQNGHPAWSPDGRWIIFVSAQDGRWVMQMISAEGGDSKELFVLEGSLVGFVEDGPGQQEELVQGQISWFQ